jgi:hypothetical protein
MITGYNSVIEDEHLELALLNKRDLVFELLVTAKGGVTNNLLLHTAAKESCVAMAKLLVEKYNVDVNTLVSRIFQELS